MKHFAIGLIALVWSSIGLAQINLEGAFGGTNNDSITFVSPLNSGTGYLIMGYTNSFTADEEIFIMRTDLAGNSVWARNFFVKNNQNEPIAICEGNDGDVIVVFAKNGTDALFVAKYNETTKEFDWQKSNPGFINAKKAYDFIAVDSNNDGTKDGYVLSIHALGNANRGQLLFINNAGEVTHKLSEDQWDVNITDLMVTNDNRLLAAGRRNDGADVILMEIDFTSFTVIEANSQMYNSKVRQSNDAKVDYVKMTQGADGSIVLIAHHSEAGKNNEGRIIIKTDADGSNPVTYEYGLANVDDFYLTDVGATSNGYTFAGYTSSSYVNSFGQKDIIFVRTDENLELKGASIFGGEKDDVGVFVFENNDNSVSIFANTNSFSDNNDNDFYVVKSSDNSPVLCNEKSVAFSIQVAESSTAVPYTNVFNTTDNVGSASDLVENYEYKDITFDPECFCEADLSFQTSSNACVGEPIMVAVPGVGLEYVWDFGSDMLDTVTIDGTLYVTYGSAGIKYIHLEVENAGGCINPATRNVDVHPLPNVEIGYDSENNDCSGYPFNFYNEETNVGNIKYHWDFGNTAVPAVATAETPAGVTFGDNTTETYVTLTVENSKCSNTDIDTIAMNPTPTANFEAMEQRCSGQHVDFAYTGTLEPTSFVWNPGPNATQGTPELNTEDVSFFTAGEHIVELKVSVGLCSDSIKKGITIYQTPLISIDNFTPICAKEEADFSVAVTPGVTSFDGQWSYSWDFGNGASPATSTSETPTGIRYEDAGTRTVTVTVKGEHCSASTTQNISINDLPVANVEEDFSICANRTATIGGDAIADYTYAWYGSDMETITDVTNENPEVAPESSETTYWLTVTNASNGCVNYDTVVVYMKQAVDVDAGQDVEICFGDSIQIGAAFIEGQTYMWTVVNEMDNSQASSPIVWPTKTTDYILSSQFEDCDAIYDTVRVIVNQLPDVIATDDTYADTTIIARGESVQLIASGAIEYEWETYIGLDNPGIDDPIASPEDTTMYTATGIDINGCINSDSVLVIVRTPNTWIPTSFTPNGDELNDEFLVRTEGEVDNFVLHIFTRSGEEIFYSTDASEAWDGTNQTTSEDMPIGAYIYYTHGTLSNGELFEFKDVINLVR